MKGLKVPFSADYTKFEKDLVSMRGEVKDFTKGVTKDLDNSVSGTKRLADGFGKVLGAIAATGAALATIKSTLDFAQEIKKQSSEAQMDMEKFQTSLNLVMDAGQNSEALLGALRSINTRVQQAKEGSKQYVDIINRMGYSTEQFVALSTEDRLEAIARNYNSATDKSKAYLDVVTLMGEDAGPKLLEVLKKIGTEGFDKLNEKMEKSGRIMKTDAIENLNNMKVALDEATSKIKTGIGTLLHWASVPLGFDKRTKEIKKAREEMEKYNNEFQKLERKQAVLMAKQQAREEGRDPNKITEKDIEHELRVIKKADANNGNISYEQKLDFARRNVKMEDDTKSQQDAKKNWEIAKKGLGSLWDVTKKVVGPGDELGDFTDPEKINKKGKSKGIAVSSLASIGGGGNVGAGNPIEIQRKQLNFLEMIAKNTLPKEGQKKNNNGMGA
jgi:hypothetical protein